MSFVCGFCGRPMPSGATPIKVVVATRDKTYAERPLPDNKFDKGGVGWEIAKEVLSCRRCFEERNETKK